MAFSFVRDAREVARVSGVVEGFGLGWSGLRGLKTRERKALVCRETTLGVRGDTNLSEESCAMARG